MAALAEEGTSRWPKGRASKSRCAGVCAADALVTVGATSALVFLDGELGPVSFTLRRATALAVLALIAAFRMSRSGGWRVAGWAAGIAAVAIVARGPSVPIALVGFIMAITAIEIEGGSRSPDPQVVVGLVPACLSYVALRFLVDLVPQAGMIAETVARGADEYVNRVRGSEDYLSFTALGGPAVVLAVFFLLWSWRGAGGIGRVVAAVAIPLGWFALLPVVTPEVSAGPIAAFSRGAYHGVFWLVVAGVVGAVGPAGRVGRSAPGTGGDSPRATPSPAFRAPAPQGGEGIGQTRRNSSSARRIPVMAAGLAAALAGVCLVGAPVIGPPAGASIRVHNFGGLDWDRPVFGQFGAFSGGMFGLLPVYCRAEGYDFDVIDHEEQSGSDGTLASPQVKSIATGLCSCRSPVAGSCLVTNDSSSCGGESANRR